MLVPRALAARRRTLPCRRPFGSQQTHFFLFGGIFLLLHPNIAINVFHCRIATHRRRHRRFFFIASAAVRRIGFGNIPFRRAVSLQQRLQQQPFFFPAQTCHHIFKRRI